tara:strand:+ start:303 stop:800 length:498 start_codon:yes stop_codon:yes gene_type:complete
MTSSKTAAAKFLTVPPNLALDFLVLFARFESSAKALGFFDDVNQTPKVSWSKVAVCIDEGFQAKKQSDKKLSQLVDWLLKEPPKKQVVVEGEASFQSRTPTGKSETEVLLQLVARIRNNLFHGNKGFIRSDAVRDEDLLTAGLDLIHHFSVSEGRFAARFEDVIS